MRFYLLIVRIQYSQNRLHGIRATEAAGFGIATRGIGQGSRESVQIYWLCPRVRELVESYLSLLAHISPLSRGPSTERFIYGALMQSNLFQKDGLTDPTRVPLNSMRQEGLHHLYVYCLFFTDQEAVSGDL